MRVAEPAVERVWGNGDGRVRNAAQLGQVDDLHAVSAGLRDDEGVVVVDLDVAPQRARRCRGQVGHEERVERVGDVDEGGAIGPAENHVFCAVDGVDPAPDVVGIATPEGVEPQKGHEVNVLAGIATRHSVLARGLTLEEGRAEQEGQEEQGTVHGAKIVVGIRRMRARALRCIGLDGEMFRFDSEWSKPFRGLSVCLLRCS